MGDKEVGYKDVFESDPLTILQKSYDSCFEFLHEVWSILVDAHHEVMINEDGDYVVNTEIGVVFINPELYMLRDFSYTLRVHVNFKYQSYDVMDEDTSINDLRDIYKYNYDRRDKDRDALYTFINRDFVGFTPPGEPYADRFYISLKRVDVEAGVIDPKRGERIYYASFVLSFHVEDEEQLQPGRNAPKSVAATTKVGRR